MGYLQLHSAVRLVLQAQTSPTEAQVITPQNTFPSFLSLVVCFTPLHLMLGIIHADMQRWTVHLEVDEVHLLEYLLFESVIIFSENV